MFYAAFHMPGDKRSSEISHLERYFDVLGHSDVVEDIGIASGHAPITVLSTLMNSRTKNRTIHLPEDSE